MRPFTFPPKFSEILAILAEEYPLQILANAII
jgi:hypothetical protein